MAYEPWQIAVLQRYGLADAAGNPVMTQLRTLGDKEAAPKVDPEIIKRLFLADTTPDHKWTALYPITITVGEKQHPSTRSWTFYQAGGSDTAMRQSEQALNYLKQRFIHQYGEQSWVEHEPKFRMELESADQDIGTKMRGSFGFTRKWPGDKSVYEHVVVALTTFLKQYRKLLEMNKTVPDNLIQPTEPDEIESWQVMQEINKKVSNWVAAKRVRTDVRLASNKQEDWIYNDDYIMALAPLTYAAAVKYGWQGWDIADPEQFGKASQGELSGNPWDTFVARGGLVVMLQFHVPMPWWIQREAGGENQGAYTNYGLENLLLNLSKASASANPDNWKVTDEEHHEEMTVAQVKDMIRHEAKRADAAAPVPADVPQVRARGYQQVPHPAYQAKSTFPVERGGQAVASQQEAEEIISHLDLCLAEIQRWAKKFKGAVAKVMPGKEAE